MNGGFWSRLSFPSFPVVFGFSLGVVLHIPWRAHNQNHSFAIFIEDADGKHDEGLQGEFQTGTAPDVRPGDFTEGVIPFAVQVANYVFQRPGDYAAVLHVDGMEIKRWRFRAIQVVGLPGARAGGGVIGGGGSDA